MNDRHLYDVTVEEVHSGDDLMLLVNLGIDNLFKKVRARLHGVDAPNAYRAKPDTEAGQVRDEVKKMIQGARCQVQVVSQGKGGWIVILFIHPPEGRTSVSLNDLLISRGYVFTDRSRTSEQTI